MYDSRFYGPVVFQLFLPKLASAMTSGLKFLCILSSVKSSSRVLWEPSPRRFQSTAFLGGNIAFLGLKHYWRFHPYLESVLMMSIDNPTSMEPPGAYSSFEQTLAPLHLFALLYLFSILLGRTTQLQRPHMVPKIRRIPFSTVLGKSYGIGSYQQYSYWLGLSQLSTAQASQCRMELGT